MFIGSNTRRAGSGGVVGISGAQAMLERRWFSLPRDRLCGRSLNLVFGAFFR